MLYFLELFICVKIHNKDTAKDKYEDEDEDKDKEKDLIFKSTTTDNSG